MLKSLTGTVLKKTAKTVATSALEGVSFLMDKGAELADDAQEWVESLDTKDISAREERQKKRNSEKNIVD